MPGDQTAETVDASSTTDETAYDDTIDWDDYWTQADESVRRSLDANPTAEFVRDPLIEFLGATDGVDSYADVGCGTGSAVFTVAEAYPEADVRGYDAAESALDANREHARQAGYGNVGFDRTVLPAFDPGREFEVVSSFFTLCYVAETERAIRNLYDAVAAGGCLVFTYHNRFARSFYEDVADDPRGYMDGSFPDDPERFRERFELVLEGESLLSYEQIEDALGTRPRSVWSEVEAERYGASRAIPLVYVPK